MLGADIGSWGRSQRRQVGRRKMLHGGACSCLRCYKFSVPNVIIGNFGFDTLEGFLLRHF